MKKQALESLLTDFKNNKVNLEEVILKIKQEPFEDLGFAKIDHQRELRQGYAEVIYGAGKTKKQIDKIVQSLLKKTDTVLITRIGKKKANYLKKHYHVNYHKAAKTAIIGPLPNPDGLGKVLVITGGTSDLPVAEEAALTLEAFGNKVERIYDVGVAGIHRLLSYVPNIMNARCIIAVAGMEGALASVVGGLADCPVIAVPTAVGYGASFNGLTPLLAMLNSCASGVSVVNINNGFGAGYIASMINHLK